MIYSVFYCINETIGAIMQERMFIDKCEEKLCRSSLISNFPIKRLQEQSIVSKKVNSLI